jgi:glycosyltransferase involved in cell wall biosynthesis
MADKQLKDLTLTLFFTAGMGLSNWARNGNLGREIELYNRLAGSLGRVNLVTYGGAADRACAPEVPKLELLPVSWRRRQAFTALDLLLRHSPQLLRSDILKTNQIRGAQIPVWIKKVYHKKLIVRCGFLHSFFTRRQTGDQARIKDAVDLERTAFRAADLGIVTSAWQRDLVLADYGLTPEKIRVIPNYVLTDIFRPLPDAPRDYDLIFIGRGDAQKNLGSLLEALARLKARGKDLSMLMVGSCCGEESVRRAVEQNRLRVSFAPSVPSLDLPVWLNRARAFVLPSLYEGHPKVLLEAMSCGLACIGTDVVGIREDIRHLETGFLCGTAPESLAAALDRVLSDSGLRAGLGANAREYVRSRYDIELVLKLELDAIREVSGR